MTLDEITQKVLSMEPRLVEAREAAALVESCGVNDRIAYSDFGLPDTFAVGQHILGVRRTMACAEQADSSPPCFTFLGEARFAAHKFSINLAYALPWTVLLIVEYLKPSLLRLSPEWGGILSLSLIASLVSPSGFSQAIPRIGYFYIGMKEPR